jgi:hypothetical protein
VEDIGEPPVITKAKRYAIGITETDRDHAWKGASVEWTNQDMWVPPPPPVGQFIDETLWVGTTNSNVCWVEVGDSEHYDKNTGISSRNYYWAENSLANGYHEFNLKGPAYPAVGAYQTYTIYLDPDRAAYEIVIGITNVGESTQPGDTIYANVGLETTTAQGRIRIPVQFRNFQIYDGRAYWPWPNHTSSVDFPAWWIWNWPNATNGIPIPFLPFTR